MDTGVKYCSPAHHVKHGIKDGTCYSTKNLRTIAQEYNKLVQKDERISLNQSKTNLYNSLERAFQNVCSNELCWAKQLRDHPVRKKVMEAFRPPKPTEWYEDPKTWLNTYDIKNVIEQYEILYKDFKFLGVFSIDFNESHPYGGCIGDFMCTFRIESLLKEKKKRFAFVLNLDKHTGPGIHWMSVYCNLNPKKTNFGIYYYDSVANETPKQVDKFMKMINQNVKEVFPPNIASKFELKSNKIQKQKKNTECGVFSIIFITQCLKQIPFEYICKHMKTDDEINRLRDVIYAPFHD